MKKQGKQADLEEKESEDQSIKKQYSNFNIWLFNFHKPIHETATFVITVGAFVGAVVLVIDAIPENYKPSIDYLTSINAVVHMIMCVMVVAFIKEVHVKLPNDPIKLQKLNDGFSFRSAPQTQDDKTRMTSLFQRANKEIRQFNNFWVATWICWLILYLIIFLHNFIPEKEFRVWFEFGQDVTNNLASLMLLYCFITLSFPSKEAESSHVRSWTPYLALMLGLIILEIIFRVTSTSDQAELVNLVFSSISGIIAGAVTAQLVGRLDSKLINAPVWVYFSLYVYAAIQATFGFFTFNVTQIEGTESLESAFEIMTVFMMYLALFFKGVLLLFIIWAIKSLKLFYYFLGVNIIHSFTDNKWGEFRTNFLDEESGNP